MRNINAKISTWNCISVGKLAQVSVTGDWDQFNLPVNMVKYSALTQKNLNSDTVRKVKLILAQVKRKTVASNHPARAQSIILAFALHSYIQ